VCVCKSDQISQIAAEVFLCEVVRMRLFRSHVDLYPPPLSWRPQHNTHPTMDTGNLRPSRPNVQRQRSNTTVPNATPSTALADLSEPKKPSHRHHHSHHHISRHHGKDSQLKRLQQIATLDSRSGYTASLSTNGSRRASFAGAESGREDKLAAPAVVKPEDLARERQRINTRNMYASVRCGQKA
jgi:hypothetical protein